MDINVQNFLNSIADPTQRALAEQLYINLSNNAATMATAFDRVRAAFGSMTSAAQQFTDNLTDSLDLAKAIASELNGYHTEIKRATRAMSGLVSIGQQLVDEERELDAIDEKRLKRLANEAKTKLKNFQIEAKNIAGIFSIEDKILNNATRLVNINNILSQGHNATAAKLKKKLEAEQAILNAYKQQDASYQAIQKAAERRYKLEQATTKTFGLTGAALSAASTIASKFGMSHVQDQLEDINKELREEMRKEIETNGDKALGFGRKFAYAGKAIGQTIGVLAKGMMDPLFIMGKIYTAFLEVNKAAVDYQRLTGQNAVAIAGINSSLATSVDVLTLMAEITKKTGVSASSIFSPEDLGRLAEAKNLLGLSGEQATNLGRRSKLTGQSIDGYQKSIVAATNKYNRLNGTAVAHGVVMEDVLSTSDEIALSLGGDATRISAAASAARGLGLELSKVDEIAGSLLQFEDSIGKELEAELLTGKNLNLEKAREFALTGNLAGLSDELKKNGASAAEFAGMNRIEQEALAAALGMSRQELAKTVMAQQDAKNLTDEQKAAAIGVSVEQMRSMDIQTQMTKTLDKLAQSFAPILEALVPIAETLLTAIQPIAMVIGYIASGLGSILSFLSPLITGFTIIYGLAKATAIWTTIQEAATWSILSGESGRNLLIAARQALLAGELAKAIGIAAAAAIANPFAALAGLAVAATVGYVVNSQMQDGKIAKDGRPTLFTGKDTVKLLPEDSIYSAKDGSMKVGTDLLGEKTAKASPAIEAPLLKEQSNKVSPIAEKPLLKDQSINILPTTDTTQTAITTKPQELAATSQKTTTSAPATISSVASTKEDTGSKMASALQEQISVLKQILNKDASINFDSNKANRFSTLASYKMS